jgi:Dockerin type I domain
MRKKYTIQSVVRNVRILTGLLSVGALIFLAFFAAANPSTHSEAVRSAEATRRVFMRVTPQGIIQSTQISNSKTPPAVPRIGQRRVLGPLGNTLWQYNDQAAIADGVSIDANNVWGAWTLSGARLTIHAITGNGTPAWSFSTFGSGNSGVAAAKGGDRSGFMESNAAGNDFRQHGFRSSSNGTPDWSFPYPVSDPNLPASSRKVATSRDGSTIAAVVSDSITQNSTLYIFDASTGTVIRTWTDSLRMNGVALTDNGSKALVTQDNRATLFDTSSGNIVFSVTGSGAGNIFYPISGDGSVFAVGGFNFDVYAFNGTTYVQVIHLTRANFWFGGASTVSHDGSTVGTFGANYANGWLSGEVYLFDVPSHNLLGSYPVSGTGMYQGTPIGAASNDNGTVMAFASWGTQFHDWPEVMVFNRSVQLIGQINFPGSAFSVDVTTNGQYVVGGAKAVHANQFGSGGRIELIQLQTSPTVQTAVSRKTHGGAGTFDIAMPLTGTSGVECRSGGNTHDYSLVVTFSGNVNVTGTPEAQVITGSGCVGSSGTCDPNGIVSVSGNIVTVPLTNIADAQVIDVQINGVTGASNQPAVNVNIPMGFLIADVNGNRTVNSSDVALTKSQVGQLVSNGNFREDVNASGTITATDVAIVKSDVGHSLPP